MVATDPGMTVGNPAPVVDSRTGTVWLLLCKNPAEGGEERIRKGLAERTVWVTRSADDGLTWSAPVEISRDVKRPEWTWYATGPCHGVQLRSGRLVVPCDHRVRASTVQDEGRHSHLIYSDDHGATWQIGGVVQREGTNEFGGGGAGGRERLPQLPRPGRARAPLRGLEPGRRADLPGGPLGGEPDRAGLPGVAAAPHGDRGAERVLFCNPASATRDTLTVKVSSDECRTWNAARVLEPGPAAYSDLAPAPDGKVLCLFERGDRSPYERLTLARFDLAWPQAGP